MPDNAPNTSDRVQAAALRLFATRGFQGTGIRDIAGEAGVSISTLYHYMDTKEDLLVEMMRESMRRLLEPAQRLLGTVTDPVERITGLVELHVYKHAQDNLLSVVGDTEMRALSPSYRREIVEMRANYQAMWEETITAGAATGVFRTADVKMATFALIEMCTGVAYWYSPSGRLSLDQISKSFIGMALSLLAGWRSIDPSADAALDFDTHPPLAVPNL